MNFVSNAEILVEIHKSKLLTCSYEDERYTKYDEVIWDLKDCTQENTVYRLVTASHIPLDPTRKNKSRSRNPEHRRTNYSPFQHWVLEGHQREVLRSHSRNNEFYQDHSMTKRLSEIIFLMTQKYSQKANWRHFSFLEEMQSAALLQLTTTVLEFDETKSNNPFAFITTIMTNSFLKVINSEKVNRDIRDELLIEVGLLPSWNKQ